MRDRTPVAAPHARTHLEQARAKDEEAAHAVALEEVRVVEEGGGRPRAAAAKLGEAERRGAERDAVRERVREGVG